MNKLTKIKIIMSIAIIICFSYSGSISAQSIETSVTLQMTIRNSSNGPVYRVENKVIPFGEILGYFSERLIDNARYSKVQVAMGRDVPLSVMDTIVGLLQKVGCEVDTYLFTDEFSAYEFEIKLNKPAVTFGK